MTLFELDWSDGREEKLWEDLKVAGMDLVTHLALPCVYLLFTNSLPPLINTVKAFRLVAA